MRADRYPFLRPACHPVLGSRHRVERCLHFTHIAAPPYVIGTGVVFVGENENLAVWAGVHMCGGPRHDHWLDLHPPTNRFVTDRA
jgi:hypothetical protein